MSMNPVLNLGLRWVYARATEKSTWLGILTAGASIFHMTISADLEGQLANVGIAIAGAVMIGMTEKNTVTFANVTPAGMSTREPPLGTPAPIPSSPPGTTADDLNAIELRSHQ